jgi:hypothetical protein
MDHTRSFTIDCDDCTMRRTAACHDCVVTFVCEGHQALVLDFAEMRAVRLLAAAGLVAPLRHRVTAVGS